ncbi:MAG: extracellular solute-binding protein, partial [Clostridiales bacterium]|nr:extracellular solute-binding protein [Clostridiales bacterium]
MKKMIAFVLSLILCLGAMNAFALDLESPPIEEPFAPMPENVTMTIGKSEDSNARYEPGESVDDNWRLRAFEEMLNIDFINEWSTLKDDAYQQKVALTMAMGDMPDVMTVNALQLRQMVKAGMVEDMTDAMQDYTSLELKSYWGSAEGIGLESATFDGRVMGVPGISPGADGIPLLYVRGDWMDKHGLEEPKTLDDIIHIVKVFQEKEDSMGLLAHNEIVNIGNNAYGLDALFALLGSYPEMWVNDADGNS